MEEQPKKDRGIMIIGAGPISALTDQILRHQFPDVFFVTDHEEIEPKKLLKAKKIKPLPILTPPLTRRERRKQQRKKKRR